MQLNRYLDQQIDWFAQQIDRRFTGVSCPSIEGTYLAWLDCSDAVPDGNGRPLQRALLEETGLWLSDGASFGGSSLHVRMNLACPRALLEDGLERLERFLGGVS